MKFALSLKVALVLCACASGAAADNIFVANLGVGTITKYDADGNVSPFSGAVINGPSGIALDASGNVYVSTNDNTVEKFSPTGTDLGVFASLGLNNPLGLAFDRAGNLYVANFIGNTVRKIASDGTDLGIFANVIGPTGLAFDAAANLYVANIGNTIQRFAPNGTQLSTFSSLNLNNPDGLAFDSLGFLYVANSGADMIEVFSQTGIDLGAIASSNLSGPIGLGFDTAQNLYVSNNLTATIARFASNGIDTIFASTGFSPQFLAVQRAPSLINISTRLDVLTGENVLDGGFILVGEGTKRVLIRGLGPSLAGAGLDNVLADPIIELHSSETNAVIASNDNWKDSQQTEIQTTGIPPSNDAEAALITTLTAGAYTVIERGKLNTTGLGLIEVFDLGFGFGPELANISTRGFVDDGSNVMIAGFIAASSTGGSGTVLLRALGPSLGAAGVADPLPDPFLELHDGNGALIATSDDWKSTQQTQIEATGIPPENDAEAAIVITLAPGNYTAIESGKDDQSGVGLVEVYNLH